jgi:hypothetical protein
VRGVIARSEATKQSRSVGRGLVCFTSLATTAFGIGSCQRDLVVALAMVRDGEQGPLSPPTNVRGGGHKPKFKMSPAVHLMSGGTIMLPTASFGRLPPPGRDRPHTTSRRARARPYASTRRPRRVFDRASGPCQAGTMDGTEKRSRSLAFSMVLGAGP